MLKRTITSVVSVCILLPVLILSNTWILPTGIAVVSLIALDEMYKCVGKSKKIALCAPAYLFAVMSPFLMRLLSEGGAYVGIAFIYAVVYMLYLFLLTVLSKGEMTFAETGEIFTSSVYIIAAMNAIIYVRDFEGGGQYLYLLIFMGAWVTDIFAYLTGVFFGKHKLIPEVSPKKTVEGSIGGSAFCVISFVIFGLIVDKFFGAEANLLFLALSGLAVSVVAQVGDLIMSVIKRRYGVKDYGKIFPGHGGVLDRFDSVLATSLALCAICVLAKVTGIALLSL